MKRLVLATTSLVVAGGMAAADVEISGSGELGVAGSSGADVKLHRDIRVAFGLSGATDTGLSFGGSIKMDEAAAKNSRTTKGSVHVSGAFGTLTLGDTDGGFDKALTEVGSATSIADDHTSHPGYNGNSGLDGFTGNGGNILRYDYSLGGITASVSGEFNSGDSSNSAIGVGIAWSGDVGGVGMGFGIGFQSGSGKMEDIMGTPAEMLTPAVAAKDAVAQMDRVTKGSSTAEVREWQCQATSVNDGDTPDDPSDDTLHPILAGLTVTEDTVCMDELDTANNEVEGVTYTLIHQVTTPADPLESSEPRAASAAEAAVPATYSEEIPDSVDNSKASIIGASWSVDMGNGLSTVLNYSRRTDETANSEIDARNSMKTTTHTGIGVGYSVGDITIGVNGGSSTEKMGGMETKSTGIGVAVVYSLGTGVSFQAGAGSGKTGDDKKSSWSAGLAFSF